ncbi:Very short patch repair endonuclease [Candidatus Desulfarcum epimagneticum]|uniref:Very short patch repair endonuclease n=1 Tax=uncultured Desulfobacteraceae bacterium TaxID=218296 RepID=A0A484HHI4_9BACT|nr:Very short patch repair endonuclease [uncultured Desulfobacteraceae bacterium]
MDTVTPKERSRIMAKVKGSGNKSTEQRLISLFKELGIKGWRRGYPLLGKPDFVFPKARLAVFVDGCFWHGCRDHCRLPSNNQDYWMSKIQRNVERDRLVSRKLAEKNWRVIRVWEHALKKGRHEKKLNEIKQAVDGISGDS